MRVNATDMKNSFGEFLRQCGKEDIIITKHGKDIAVLKNLDNISDSDSIPLIKEKAAAYYASGNEGPIGRMSYKEFRKFNDKAGELERYELIDGQVYMLSSPKVNHQHALSRLYGLFFNWFNGKKCVPYFSPFDITLNLQRENPDVVQPDLMVICDLEEHMAEDGYYMGVPALVVEVLSNSGRSKDLIVKMNLYMRSGIREYWIVNPFNNEISIYLFENNEIKDSRAYVMGMICESFIFKGLAVKPEDIFFHPKPHDDIIE